MKQSIWVCTCVATGNNQTNVLIKYFCYDSKIDFSIGLAQSSNGIFPVIEFQVEVLHNMYFSDSQT